MYDSQAEQARGNLDCHSGSGIHGERPYQRLKDVGGMLVVDSARLKRSYVQPVLE